MLRTDFTDAEAWQRLAEKYCTLPNWSEPCTVERMIWWCKRLDVNYQKISNTTHQEFMELNTDWPLRAFVGLLLEAKDEQAGQNGTGNKHPA